MSRWPKGLAAILLCCGAAAENWQPLPPPIVPPDNPVTAAKVALGKRLFHEPGLSITGAYSCASCHQPERHFTDGLPVAVGALGDQLARNTPTLYNVAYNASFGWDDRGITTLEAQHAIPLFNAAPVELGYRETLLASLIEDAGYRQAFQQAFDGPPDTDKLVKALASYVRTIRPPQRPFDRYLFFDEREAMSQAAHAGMSLFFSARLGCANCHASLTFSGPIQHALEQAPPVFHVTGVGGSKTPFRAPSLRMVRFTAPYMHDGSLASLQQVLKHYQNSIIERVPAFTLSGAETDQLVAFLESL